MASWIPGLVGAVFAFTGDPWPAALLLTTCFVGLVTAYVLRWRLVGDALAVHERLLQRRAATR